MNRRQIIEMALLTDEEIWIEQQRNCFWEDKEKGLAVAKAQLNKLLDLHYGYCQRKFDC